MLLEELFVKKYTELEITKDTVTDPKKYILKK